METQPGLAPGRATSSTTGAVAIGNVTITVNASSLAAGANTITAAYSGDTNYAGFSGTVVVTSTAAAPSLTISGTAVAAITAGSSGTSTVSVAPGVRIYRSGQPDLLGSWTNGRHFGPHLFLQSNLGDYLRHGGGNLHA